MATRAETTKQPGTRKSTTQVIADNSPWLPTDYEVADAAAIQELVRGDATKEQQQRAIRWIVDCSGYYDLSYRPGEDGARDTVFAEGKRSVGAQIVKLSKIALSRIRGEPTEEG